MGTQAYGSSVNGSGQVVGSSSSPSAAIATLFHKGGTTNLNTLGASVSLANGINATGQIAGEESQPNDPRFHAFLYSNGSMRSIESPSLFPDGSIAYAINKSGQVVGQGFLPSASFHAFLYRNGRMTDLNPFNGYQSIARSINDAGQIIGSSTGNHAATWLYSKGTITNLSQVNTGYSINNNGQIVGINNSSSHAELYSNGTWTDLGAFFGAKSTLALGINSSGQIVGTALFPPKSYHPFIPGKHVALIFSSNGPQDLNKRIANSNFTLTDAISINDAGQIAANAINTAGQQRTVLLTPK